MKSTLLNLCFCISLLCHTNAQAQSMDLALVNKTAEDFLRLQSKDLVGEVNIQVEKIDARLKLNNCDDLSAF
ncbi:MAG: hypothetical protein K2P84_10925, partial [Undibacterium sp.]|nr:hypothetical protein [Undibacterium sp.]